MKTNDNFVFYGEQFEFDRSQVHQVLSDDGDIEFGRLKDGRYYGVRKGLADGT